MKKRSSILSILDNFENYICGTLLVLFVILLFAQILMRELFDNSIAWGEEVAVYMFVWFVYFGASFAAKKGAHNRVTFQFKLLPPRVATGIEAFSDLIWLGFNFYFIYLSYDFVFNKMNLFWKSQTTGVPMKYIYMILPIAFTLMSIRIIQNLYKKVVVGEVIGDPEAAEIEKILEQQKEDGQSASPKGGSA